MKLKTRLKSIYRRRLKFIGALNTLIVLFLLSTPPYSLLWSLVFLSMLIYAIAGWGWEYRTSRLTRWLNVFKYKYQRARGSVFGVSYDICRAAESEMRALGEVYNIPDDVVSEYIGKFVDTAVKTIEKYD